MALFMYQGENLHGERFKGTLRANSHSEARELLRQKHIKPTILSEKEETIANKEIQLFNKVNLKLLVGYLRQFSTLISSGITIVDSSRMLEEQQTNKNFKTVLLEVCENIDNGMSLSEAYLQHPNAFPPLLTSVVSVAEKSGSLEKNIAEMADYYEKQADNKSSMITAMIYPIILLTMTFAVGIILMVTIVPMFVEVFESFDSPLPQITITTMAVSDFLMTKGVYLALGIILLIFALKLAKRNQEFSLWYDTFLLQIPLIGELIIKNSFSMFMTTLSTLLSSSVSMVTALDMSKQVISNKYIFKIITECEFEIEEGGKLSTVFRNHSVVPILVTQMIEIGENTGSLEDMLARLSAIYQKEVDEMSVRIKTILEPIVILSICIIVGLIVAAIMIPMFALFGAVQG